MHKQFLVRRLILALTFLSLSLAFSSSAYSARDKGDHPVTSTKVDTLDLDAGVKFPILLKSGYFNIDSKKDGPVNLQVTDEKCPEPSHASLFFAMQDSHLNTDGFTMGFYNDLELEENSDGYKIVGEAYEIDDSSVQPHDWVGIGWQIWCTEDDVEGDDVTLSARKHD